MIVHQSYSVDDDYDNLLCHSMEISRVVLAMLLHQCCFPALFISTTHQWRRGRGSKGAVAPTKFWAVGKQSQKNFVLVRKFSSKNAKFGAESPTLWGKFRGKIKILSSHNLLCQKFATVCRKIASCGRAYSFNPWRRCYTPSVICHCS